MTRTYEEPITKVFSSPFYMQESSRVRASETRVVLCWAVDFVTPPCRWLELVAVADVAWVLIIGKFKITFDPISMFSLQWWRSWTSTAMCAKRLHPLLNDRLNKSKRFSDNQIIYKHEHLPEASNVGVAWLQQSNFRIINLINEEFHMTRRQRKTKFNAQ